MRKQTLVILLVLVSAVLTAAESESKSKTNDDKWVCSGRKDPEKMSKKEYLKAFGDGPCSPIILLPGTGGSNLNVIIDCPVLRTSDPELFSNCGWNACDGDEDLLTNPENKSVPQKEYLAWVPHIVSPLTIFTPTEKQKKCFAGLLTLAYDITSTTTKVKPIPGIDVRIVGATQETRSKKSWDCGMDGVQLIIKDIPEVPELGYYLHTHRKLLYLGYISGLTAQALPYDWRMDNISDEVSRKYLPLIKEMYAMINKKIVLLSHSMGSFRTYALLNQMTQDDKDKYISQYIAAAPVLVGAPQVNKYFFCGSEEYHFPLNLGIDFPTFKATLGNFTSMYQLLPNDYKLLNKGTDWMNKVEARIAYEKGDSEDPVFDWMPKRDQVCYSKYPDRKYCISGLQRPDNYGQLLGQDMTDANIKDLIIKNTFAGLKGDGYKTIDDNFRYLPNINVPTTIFYSTRVPAEGGHNYKVDPTNFTKNNKFCPKESFDILWEFGDGTVPQHASTTPWIKWAYEFDQKKPLAKPVKFVEVCSDINQRMTPYDTKNEKGEWIMTKNEYQGVKCNCKQGVVKDCDHIGIIILAEFNEYLGTALQVNEKAAVSQKAQAMTEQQLQDYVNMCNMLYDTYNSFETQKMKNERESKSKIQVE